MAKKRKDIKGLNKSSSSSSSSVQNDSRNSEGRGCTRSRKSQRHKGKHSYNPGANDTKLRDSVEGDGNLTIIDMNADGNCLFRAVSDQLFWDYGNNHDQVRSDVCDFMAENKDDFAVFLVLDDDDADEEEDATDFESYVENMRQDGEWGGNLELVAAARIYRRKITVYSSMATFTIDHGENESDGPDMLVSFHDNDHYNSVRDKKHRPKPAIPETRKGGNKRNKASDSSVKTTKPKGKVVEDVEEAPAPDATLSTTKSMSEMTVKDGEETSNEPQKPVKKNSPCPCGSGQRYKKCCFAKKKHAARVQKLRGTEAAQEEKDDESSQEIDTKGNFRVLHI